MSSKPKSFRADAEIARQRDERQFKAAGSPAPIDYAKAAQERERFEDLQRAHDAKTLANRGKPFDPPPSVIEQLIEDLASNDYSLGFIASKANTSVKALTTWMARPDIAPQIAALEQAIALKTRLTILNQATGSLSACRAMFMEYQECESHTVFDPTNLKSLKTLCRVRENAIKASQVIIRLGQMLGIGNNDTPGMSGGSAGKAQRIPESSAAPELPAPSASLPSHPTSDIPHPTSVHPDAHRYPGDPPLNRDPLPDNHPAILSGAAPSSSSCSKSTSSPRASNPQPCPSCSTCPANCPSKSSRSAHPP